MKNYFLFIGILFISSCGGKEPCNIDMVLKEEFYGHYTLLEKEYKKDLVLNTDLIDAISSLSEITGIETKAAFGDISVYNKFSDYKSDMRSWRKWYEKNKCLQN